MSVLVTRPLSGESLRSYAPDCPSAVEGVASTVGIPARFDFYLALDLSGSTAQGSGVDIDGDGVVDDTLLSPDSIFAAELAAARRFLEVIDLTHHRVCIIAFDSNGHLVHPLSDERASLQASLDDLPAPAFTAQTNFGAPIVRVLAEHAVAHDPEREQIVLFLSDGAPNVAWPAPPNPLPCAGRDVECSGIQWAGEAARRGLVVNTYAVGTHASTEILAEMALVSGGRMERLDVAGEIVESLPRSSHVGIAEVLVQNLSSGAELSVQPGPDGAFVAPMVFVDGENEIVVTVVAQHEADWSASCSVTADAACIEISCPEALVVECDGDGALVPDFSAWSSDPLVKLSHRRDTGPDVPGGDASGAYPMGKTLVTWTFLDDEAGMARCSSSIEVLDTLNPRLEQPTPIVNASCDEVPAPPALLAEDDCDASPLIVYSEERVEGTCADEWELQRDWTATDSAGLQAHASQRVIVRDDLAPVLQGAPADVTASCMAVPPPARVDALDSCDPAPELTFHETRVDGPCPGSYLLERRWLVLDRCGNVAEHLQRVEVVDDEPPVIMPRADNALCLEARHHALVRVDAAEFAPTVFDACSDQAEWRVEACLSDQPDDGLGDGSTDGDCRVDADGRTLLVRAERQGRGASSHQGRSYTVIAIAEDPCGNLSAPTAIATVHVRHDSSHHDRTCE